LSVIARWKLSVDSVQKMDGEGSAFWLEEAEILAQLAMTESRLKKLAASNDDEKWVPDLGA
jgi:hypothetical protein